MSKRFAAVTTRVLLALLLSVHGAFAGATVGTVMLAPASDAPGAVDPMPCCADPAIEMASCAGSCVPVQAVLPPVAVAPSRAAAPAFAGAEIQPGGRHAGFDPPPPKRTFA